MKSNTNIFKWSNGLLHNKSACQEYFLKNNTFLFVCFFGGSLVLQNFEEKQFWWEGELEFLYFFQKQNIWVGPAHYSWSVEYNNLFSWPNCVGK